MKEIPHYIKKLNRKVVRSILREEANEQTQAQPYVIPSPPPKRSQFEIKKLAKQKIKAQTLSQMPVHDSEEERNRKRKHRVPIFDRNNALPRIAKPTKKKTPRI